MKPDLMLRNVLLELIDPDTSIYKGTIGDLHNLITEILYDEHYYCLGETHFKMLRKTMKYFKYIHKERTKFIKKLNNQ